MTSLLDFFAHVIDTYDTENIKPVDLVYLDFQKAFDKEPHEGLMLKVTGHGIQGDAARWIRNWSAGRRQQICIKDPIATGHKSHLLYHKVVYLAHYYFLHFLK